MVVEAGVLLLAPADHPSGDVLVAQDLGVGPLVGVGLGELRASGPDGRRARGPARAARRRRGRGRAGARSCRDGHAAEQARRVGRGDRVACRLAQRRQRQRCRSPVGRSRRRAARSRRRAPSRRSRAARRTRRRSRRAGPAHPARRARRGARRAAARRRPASPRRCAGAGGRPGPTPPTRTTPVHLRHVAGERRPPGRSGGHGRRHRMPRRRPRMDEQRRAARRDAVQQRCHALEPAARGERAGRDRYAGGAGGERARRRPPRRGSCSATAPHRPNGAPSSRTPAWKASSSGADSSRGSDSMPSGHDRHTSARSRPSASRAPARAAGSCAASSRRWAGSPFEAEGPLAGAAIQARGRAATRQLGEEVLRPQVLVDVGAGHWRDISKNRSAFTGLYREARVAPPPE